MIKLSPIAQEEVKQLLEKQAKPGAFFRIGVRGGGCSGMTYDVKIDHELKEHDRVFVIEGLQVVSDVKSLLYLDGMTIDYSRDLVGGGFRFINPNATGSCGCGTSFSA